LDRLQSETGENRVLLRCMLNRGLTSAEEIRKFLAPEFIDDMHSPFLLRDMDRAVERLRRAIRDRERIMIVTDFDVDDLRIRVFGDVAIIHGRTRSRCRTGGAAADSTPMSGRSVRAAGWRCQPTSRG